MVIESINAIVNCWNQRGLTLGVRISNFEDGGLKDIDIESKLKALKLS